MQAPVFAVASSRDQQASMRFVRLEVTSMAEVSNLDIPGDADMFARAGIGPQRYVSAVINSRDSFSFRRPHAPFTWLRSVLRTADFPTPVTSILVRIRTGDVRFAGTDDDVHLRVGGRRFSLDKRIYDDFERGDDDLYSVPLDGALEDGFDAGDIRVLQIEKSRDGIAGGWRLGGASVFVNGQRVAHAPRINRWLEDDHRTHRLPLAPLPARGAALPVYLALWELDAPLRGGNDHTDLHPWDRRKDIGIAYAPGSGTVAGGERGGSRFAGRVGDGETAKLTWRLSTVDPALPTVDFPPPATTPTAPQPMLPPPPMPADLRITAFDLNSVTVVNEGTGPAGPFIVSINFAGNKAVPGLAAGASVTIPAPQTCSDGQVYTATADSASQVPESDETDNVLQLGPVFC